MRELSIKEMESVNGGGIDNTDAGNLIVLLAGAGLAIGSAPVFLVGFAAAAICYSLD